MINELKVKYYIGEILKTKIGNSHGVFIKAKPIFLMAIINCIESKHLSANEILLDDDILKDEYYGLFKTLQPEVKPSPYLLPYFHLSSESYYSIFWTGEPFKPHPKAHSPSERYLRLNSTHSYLDGALWGLLQDEEARSFIKQQIVNFYFKAR